MQPDQQAQNPASSQQGVVSSGQNPQAQAPVATVRNPNSSQNSLLLSELRENMVVMNDGSFRAVIACQSINFDLMSEREREGVEYSYQSFLNSLYFPIQIFIRSQRVDIAPYLERLSNIRRDQDNMLLGVLMEDYINFINDLAEQTNIMDKSFFIVVPYYPAGDISSALNTSKSTLANLFVPTKQHQVVVDKNTYEKARTEIQNRVNAVLSGLFQMGVRGVQLDTKGLGELYYNVYNPDTAVREPLADFQAFTGTYVKKAGENSSNLAQNEVAGA
jgi:type IV secretory pathway VirB4 component